MRQLPVRRWGPGAQPPASGAVAVTSQLPTAPPVPLAAGSAAQIVDRVASVVLGQRQQIVLVVAGLLAGGHVLVEDVPGVGKTLLAKSLARCLGGTAGRVQGTADLLPADITGVTVYDPAERTWQFHPGPIFNNVVLLDEVNRATPRAQSALLEAMAEGQVTVDGTAHRLPRPFFVVATQNPTGDAGTFPLVEGQLDRFALVVSLGLPGRDAERAILGGDGGPAALERLHPVVDGAGLLAAQAEARRLHASTAVTDFVLDVVDATRASVEVDRGASPRAARALLDVARGHALLAGRDFVAPDDVKAVAPAVLGHRVGPSGRPGADAGRRLVADLLASVPAPPV